MCRTVPRTPGPGLYPPGRPQPQRQHPRPHCHQLPAGGRGGAQALHGQGQRHPGRGEAPLHRRCYAPLPGRGHGAVPGGGAVPDRPAGWEQEPCHRTGVLGAEERAACSGHRSCRPG